MLVGTPGDFYIMDMNFHKCLDTKKSPITKAQPGFRNYFRRATIDPEAKRYTLQCPEKHYKHNTAQYIIDRDTGLAMGKGGSSWIIALEYFLSI